MNRRRDNHDPGSNSRRMKAQRRSGPSWTGHSISEVKIGELAGILRVYEFIHCQG